MAPRPRRSSPAIFAAVAALSALQAGHGLVASCGVVAETFADPVAQEFRYLCEEVRLGLPTVPRSSPDFEARRYWRGPVWAIVNWLLILGLRRNGRLDLAERLRTGTLTAIETAGFGEHFDPLTGEGGGGGRSRGPPQPTSCSRNATRSTASLH
jgi:glycogen debranching enzyme